MRDEEIADLLGQAPSPVDPGFRLDVFARVAHEQRRRTARRRALGWVVLSTGLGVIFPIAGALGATPQGAQPIMLAVGAVALAGLAASALAHGPRAALQRSRVLLRFS